MNNSLLSCSLDRITFVQNFTLGVVSLFCIWQHPVSRFYCRLLPLYAIKILALNNVEIIQERQLDLKLAFNK